MTTTTPGPYHAGPARSLRLLPAPVSEPPYDDEVGGRSDEPVVQGALALAYVLPGGLPARPEPPAQLRLIEVEPPRPAARGGDAGGHGEDGDGREDTEDDVVRRRTPSAELPEPRRWTAQLAQAVAEVVGGHRPPRQLLRWTDEEVYATVAMRAETARRRPGARPLVRALRLTSPRDGVVEAGAVVQSGPRCRAIALRLEGLDGRWRCTALEVI